MFRIDHLSKNFGGRTIFKDISYNFPENKIIALIGVNGAGKTTFLNVITRLEELDSGEILTSKDLRVSYLPQAPNPTPAMTVMEECMVGSTDVYPLKCILDQLYRDMETAESPDIFERYEEVENAYRQKGGYGLEADAEKILLGLGFTRAHLTSDPQLLSGGWRMRLELAKILLPNPDFLVLDEPTNHLDLPSIIWLENYLKAFKGTLLFISHDVDLLNRLPQIILHLKDGNLSEYYGNYDKFLLQYEERQAAKVAEVKNLEKRIDQVSLFVDKFKAKASKATLAQSKMKMLVKLQAEANAISIDRDDAEMTVRLPLTRKSGQDVLHVKNAAIGYTTPLVKNLSFMVRRGQKIAIVGANGLGKSTLLKSIHSLLPLLAGELRLGHNVHAAYYAQDQLEYLDATKTVLENIMQSASRLPEREARRVLGSFLLRGDDVFKPVSVLSGGEKSRLSLACLLVQDVNFLLLDEPTNHLDMLSSDILAESLSHYEGTVMFVSHNRTFINQVATHILLLSSNHTAHLMEGTLEDIGPLAF